jgi:hypothetical protein
MVNELQAVVTNFTAGTRSDISLKVAHIGSKFNVISAVMAVVQQHLISSAIFHCNY